MEPSKRPYGLPRRIFAGFIGASLLAFLALNVADGVIYLHGNGVSRVEHPIAFWIEAAGLAVVGLAALYWALIEARRGKPDSDT